MSAEPTAEQRDAAWAALHPESLPDLRHMYTADQRARVDRVARALAAAVTAEREKYLRVADYFDRQADTARDLSEQHWQDGEGPVRGANMTGQHLAYVEAARRIREVSS